MVNKILIALQKKHISAKEAFKCRTFAVKFLIYMKKSILTCLVFASFSMLLSAQVQFGPRVGFSATAVSSEDLILKTATDSIKMRLVDAKYSVHFGAFMQYKYKRFFVQPELLYNSSKFTYNVTDFKNAAFTDSAFTQRFQQLDLPLILGFKFGIVRVQGGPVGHYTLTDKSDLSSFDKVIQTSPDFTYGWQAGIGFDIGSVLVDLKYEDNFSTIGNDLIYGGQTFNFTNSPARIMATLGYKF